jgi:hypothetical protein
LTVTTLSISSATGLIGGVSTVAWCCLAPGFPESVADEDGLPETTSDGFDALRMMTRYLGEASTLILDAFKMIWRLITPKD